MYLSRFHSFWTKIALGLVISGAFFALCWAAYAVATSNAQEKCRFMQLELRNIKEQNRTMATGNERMTKRIVAFEHDPRMLEKVAREELGMIQENEIIYLFPHVLADDLNNKPHTSIARASRLGSNR